MWDPVVICTVAPIWDPFGPCGSSGLLVYGTHVGSPRFIPCGLLVYGTHVGSPRLIPCGLLVYGTHVGSSRCISCGLVVYGTHVGFPDGSHLGMWVAYGARLAQVGPSRHLHRGTHLGPMLAKVVLTYFRHLLNLGLAVTDCYIKYIIPGHLRIDMLNWTKSALCFYVPFLKLLQSCSLKLRFQMLASICK